MHEAMRRVSVAATAALFALPLLVAAQAPNKANWALADKFSPDKLRPITYTSTVNARFIGKSDSLWYNWKDRTGSSFQLVVPATKVKRPLFDHQKLAAALSAQAKKPLDAFNLPFTTLRFTDDHKSVIFVVDTVRYQWSLAGEALQNLGKMTREELQREMVLQNAGGEGGGRQGGGGGGRQGGFGGPTADFRNFSPDSTAYVYAMDHNLYVVETKGDTTPVKLTTDGVRYYSFGSRDGDGNQQQQQQQDEENQEQQGRARDPRVRANVTWSPDSKGFAVQRTDSRAVKELYLVDVLADPRPRLVSYKYAMPGEDTVPQQEIYGFKRGERQLTRLPIEKWKDQRLFDLHFPVDVENLRLVRRDRLQRTQELIEINLASKAIKSLLTDATENAFLERQNVRYLTKGGDFIWWSERSGWGHYYLYDFNGKLKNQITSGAWRAEQIVELDSIRGIVWVRGVGREPGETPYFSHLYRVNMNGTGIALLDAGDATHQSRLTPSRRYVIDTYSRTDLVPKSVLRDAATGAQIMELETMDVSRLQELGWKAPERFTVKAADGVTDIYGNIWKPFDFDPNKKYPIIAHVYPGPQTEQVTYTFTAGGNQQQLAQLGFIVIQIGNRGGSPQRSNAYHSFGYYNLRDYGLADKKAGIEQLAARFSWIDVTKVGIFGHSGGGFMTAAALLQPPYNDFFKVGVSSAGNHDNNVYNQNWSEQHHGLREVRIPKNAIASANSAAGQRVAGRGGRGGNAGGQQAVQGQGDQGAAQQKASGEALDDTNSVLKFEIKVPANHELAANLKGNLLLVHGDMDNNVHPAGTIRLANALIKANKRFDFMVMPGKPHGFGDMQPYFNRMTMEYFSEHLLGDYYKRTPDIR
jgi:dipeptidyl-peptidase-4